MNRLMSYWARYDGLTLYWVRINLRVYKCIQYHLNLKGDVGEIRKK